MYHRLVNILESKSFFIFGARGTGKSSLLKLRFKDKSILWIDLLNNSDFLTYSRNPSILYNQIIKLNADTENNRSWVVIDEIQRVPALLNEVHRVIESDELKQPINFALTGSSARKLKRGAANLLAGRALVNNLYPLTYFELGSDFDLDSVLNWGSLPSIISSQDELVRAESLESYYATYLREEIREEQIVRQLDPFTRFLETAAQSSGQIVNYSAISKDCLVDQKAVSRYYQILEDTLLGHFLPSFDHSIRKQQSKSPRFYFFDLGVQRAIRGALNVKTTPQSYGYGNLFEQFIVLEIIRLNAYLRKRYKLSYLRTKDDAEIDLVIERPSLSTLLIEIKSSTTADISQAKHLQSLRKYFANAECWLISQDLKNRLEDDIQIIHWKKALKEIFPIN